MRSSTQRESSFVRQVAGDGGGFDVAPRSLARTCSINHADSSSKRRSSCFRAAIFGSPFVVQELKAMREPSGEGHFLIPRETVEREIGFGETLLHDFFDLFPPAEEAPGDQSDPPPVAVKKFLEGRFVACPDARHQLDVRHLV